MGSMRLQRNFLPARPHNPENRSIATSMLPPDAAADFVENAAMAINWVGPDGVILRANQAELQLLGYARDEYVGRNIVEFHADAEVIADILRRLNAGETLRDQPARLRCGDGSIRQVRITANVRWQDGRFLHARCITRDVSQDRQTVDYLEGLMEGFVAYDENWRMTYMNAAAERILGRQRADVLGKTWHQAFPHAVGNPVDHMYQRVMERRVGERMEYYYPHYRRWLEISASPVSTGGVAVYFRDVTDRMQAFTDLKGATERLLDADRRKDEFLATLAHELRNPLAPIRNGLYLLRIADRASETAEQARAMLERQVRHLVRLVDDLLDVSRITRGRLEMRREPVEAAAVVGAAVETSQPAIDSAGHRLAVELPPEVLMLNADPVRIAQVLANLLNNAAKYTPAGGDIRLTVRRDGDAAVISVRDSGVGIPHHMLERVFDMFTQVDATSAHGGLGIGLTLARRLVQLHGGTIEARSAGAGEGSEFVVRLPLAVRAQSLGGEARQDANVLHGASS
jgi:PAS domain S-box-containing protein